MKPSLLVAAACAGVVTLAGTAFADESGYLCNVVYTPGSTSAGSYGFVSTTIYAGPNCTGAVGNTYYLCSANASNNKCSSSTAHRATTVVQMVTIAETAAIASLQDTPVTMVAAAGCAGTGGTICGAYISYR